MRTKSVWTKWLVLIFSIALLASCGGGGGGGGTPPAAPADEGSIASPVNLGTVSTTVTHSGSVGVVVGTSFYRFTTGSTAGSYVISLTNTQSDLDWALFSDSGFTTLVGLCDNFMTPGPNNESCSASLSANTTYYLAVDEYDLVAGTYTLTVTPPVPPATPGGVAAAAGYGKVTISWYNATGATSYNVYWSTTSGGASSGGTKISGIATTSYDHVVAATGIPYYYVVTAENANGESAKSTPEVTATPLAKQVPPLTYNFDDGTRQGWTTNSIWNVNTVYANSGTYSVTDSPLGNYQNSSNTWLASPMIDLTGTTTPKLTFWHRYLTETDYDKAYVEISTNGGNTFTNITPGLPGYLYYSGTLSTFTLVTIDLSAYKASNTVVIRFRLQTDSSMWYDGWYIDDIGISAI